MQPTICAVMVTGKPGRLHLARESLASFHAQDYPHKHLLIINDGERVLTEKHREVTELQLCGGWSLGQLRNYALDNLPDHARHVMQWDDDDFSHPTRMRRQLQYQGEFKASVLRYVTHCNIRSGTMRICVPTRRPNYGFPGTLMHNADTPHRYPEIGKGEDTEFVRNWIRERQLAVVNNTTSPILYVRCYHGLNTWSERHVMGFPHSGLALSHGDRHYVSQLRHRLRQPD